MRTAPPALFPLLRSQVQGDLLAELYLHPEREYSLTDIATTIGVSVKAVHHEASRLTAAGLTQDRRYGNLRLLRATTDGILSRPLTDLLLVTYGPLPVLSEALANVDGIEEAYIYGSWAARYRGEPGTPPADVDVLVIGEADPDILDETAAEARNRLRRAVNIRRVQPRIWQHPDPADPFLASIKSRPLVPLHL